MSLQRLLEERAAERAAQDERARALIDRDIEREKSWTVALYGEVCPCLRTTERSPCMCCCIPPYDELENASGKTLYRFPPSIADDVVDCWGYCKCRWCVDYRNATNGDDDMHHEADPNPTGVIMCCRAATYRVPWWSQEHIATRRLSFQRFVGNPCLVACFFLSVAVAVIQGLSDLGVETFPAKQTWYVGGIAVFVSSVIVALAGGCSLIPTDCCCNQPQRILPVPTRA
jgi:hypothetical protein